MEKKLSQETLCVHARAELITNSQGVITPVFLATSYKYRETSENTYPRYFNTITQKVNIEKLWPLKAERTESSLAPEWHLKALTFGV